MTKRVAIQINSGQDTPAPYTRGSQARVMTGAASSAPPKDPIQINDAWGTWGKRETLIEKAALIAETTSIALAT
jgi:hypothetical protein